MTETLENATPEVRYKCHTCHNFFKDSQRVGEKKACPVCGEVHLAEMCKLDHNGCTHEIVSGIAYCPECKDPVCPICGTHDVIQISRVTGYMQEVKGWNAAKQQELKDRARYQIGNTGVVGSSTKTTHQPELIVSRQTSLPQVQAVKKPDLHMQVSQTQAAS